MPTGARQDSIAPDFALYSPWPSGKLKFDSRRFAMIALKRVRLVLSLLIVLVVSLPFGAFAQDPKKDDEKKDDKKEKKEEELPLKTDKKIEFTTDEGTWMSLDVSSDAKTIVF